MRAAVRAAVLVLLKAPHFYTRRLAAGYSSGDPKGRVPGALSSGLVYVALILATGVVGVRAALGV